MFNCENCVKNDVCGKKEEVNELLKKMCLNSIYQTLATKNIKMRMDCENYLKQNECKILRGVNDANI